MNDKNDIMIEVAGRGEFMINGALEILNRYYGYSTFRSGQEKVITEILMGRDAVAIMPTGGGKSICYQIPAMLLEGVTLVISPLISLMKDQVDNINELGIKADFINSSLSNNEIFGVLSRIKNKELKLVYVAPERLESPMFLDLISSVDISQIAVDEAHCVSQWGHDFRTSYRQIPGFIDALKKRPIVTAFTATATAEVREDIVRLLKLKQPKVLIQGFDRENLDLNILKGVNKKEYILNYIKENSEQSGIIYAATRKETDAIYELLTIKKFSVARYHAGLNEKERSKNQEDFVKDEVNIIVATNAFGMGIDKPNIRFVIHYNMPKNIESYYQEIGRAGRDGLKSECTLLFAPGDVQTQKYLIDVGISSPERKVNEYKKLQDMLDLVHSKACYRSYILRYFGEEGMESCENCSNCNNSGELIDRTEDAQKVISCIYRMKRAYGVNMIIDVLRGSGNKKIMDFRLNELTTYGIMKEFSKDNLKDFINALVSHSYIDILEGEYPVLKLNDNSMDILKGESKVVFKEIKVVEKAVVNDTLFDRLKALRKELANAEGVPPYIIFGDNTLREMSSRYPKSREQFLDISGVGEAKAKKYCTIFIEEILKYLEKNEVEIKWETKKNITLKDEMPSKIKGEEKLQRATKEKSYVVTINMLRELQDIKAVAKERDLAITTIFSHINDYLQDGNTIDFTINFNHMFNEDIENEILEVIRQTGIERLKPIKEKLTKEISYDVIRGVILKNFYKAG